ncbi:MAG TPA: hypothetical protein VFT29_12710 [Gemmatimonadaceae bacterium]|nr:hypothetical protein [Gemmatimonadaceae bacterium]
MRQVRGRTRVVPGMACVVVMLWSASRLDAQVTPASTDARLLARADSITVGQYCTSVRTILASPVVRDSLGDELENAERDAAAICDPRTARATLGELLGDRPVTLAGVARVESRNVASAAPDVIGAMNDFHRVTRNEAMAPVIKLAIGDSATRVFRREADTAKDLLRRDVRDAALRRLDRYERKLGPHSARLNGVEVVLNYAAQRGVPGFKATPEKGPSPWEVVASYVPMWATIADERAQAVSVGEFGLRYYLFGEKFGASGLRGLLFPYYWSAGALVVSDRNGALVWPGEGKSRVGAYLSWGAFKIGYVGGRSGEVLVSRQLQLIPYVF